MTKNTGSSLESRLQDRATGGNTQVANQGNGLKSLLNSPAIKKRFEEMLDRRAPQYITSITNLWSSEKSLQNCDPMSVISSCIVAATLDLPVDKNLGYAWIVPYNGVATFQLGYKGYIQLALRTAKYKAINVLAIHEGELQDWNPLTENLVVDYKKKKSDAITSYAGYFELINGFRKTVHWTKEEIESHRKKHSKSDYGWKKDYDAMALKTVIRNMLSKWGILSIEMQEAYINDDTAELDKTDGGKPQKIIDITATSVESLEAGSGNNGSDDIDKYLQGFLNE
ncbi:recombinase RecT [Paenibacillus elgii]|uniref:recombinase RecT n=1 Tax=Paenibacillus elgii TaxID=189691 RepID=UPI00203B9372|nr:recombinase RecT [Paenibacillus elgii]MCM3272593.1 recombinase RecT [Paenibacillus elgii]